MIYKSKHIEQAIAKSCARTDVRLAAYGLGSFGKYDFRVEEYDFVIVFADGSDFEQQQIAKELESNLSWGRVVLRLASHFVPRSYQHDLTLHGAFYSQAELNDRTPRILSAFQDYKLLFGDSTIVPEVMDVEPFTDLLVGRWSTSHALQILLAGGWSVPMWCFDQPIPYRKEIWFDLEQEEVFAEFVWYFASKLTANALDDAKRNGINVEDDDVRAVVEQIQSLIGQLRKRVSSRNLVRNMSELGVSWIVLFQDYLLRCIAELRKIDQASYSERKSFVTSGV